MFGLESRAACIDRVRRLLDSDRPVRIRPSPWSLAGLLLLAVVAVPHLRAAGDADSDSPAAKKGTAAKQPAQKSGDDAAGDRLFELRVVQPDGKPISEAVVELRTRPIPAAEQVRQGKFIRKGPYGAFVATDAEGRLVVTLPQRPDNFNVDITIPGYGPYWAGWSSEEHDQPIPARLTAELEAGWSVGGIIVDSQGKPVKGVKIHPSINFKKRTGDQHQLGVGAEQTTDAAGRWRFDSVPASMSEVFVEISHSGFMPNRRALTRSEFGIERGQEPAGKVVLDRGLTVSGTVTDEAGKPIVGALIRTKFLNDIREAKTGDNGVYRLEGCEPRMTRIVVSAKGRATDMQEVRVDPEMDPVDFQMKPGGKVRIRVLDEHDHPIPKARIFFQRWRSPQFSYFEFDHVSQYADANGVWIWNEAPLDEFQADICSTDGMYLARQPLIARDEEYVFRTPPALVISGNVIDAETRKPLAKFTVVPGSRFDNATQLHWYDSDRFAAADGKYQIRQTRPQFAHLIRIEASGYQAAVSRDIKSNEGNVSIDFELKKGIDVAATVLTPDGKPAAKARVALGIAGSQINIKNGEIDDRSTYCERQDANDSGQFRFPPQDAAFQLVILHPAGFAHVKALPGTMPETIELTAWARVEGTLRIGKNLASGLSVTINSEGLHSYGEGVPSVFTQYSATTGKEGHFVFERVFPGTGRFGRQVIHMMNQGVIPFGSSCSVPVGFAAGETTRLELGGVGRPVVGKLRPPDGFPGRVNWNFAIIEVQSFLPEPPMPAEPAIPADIAADPVKKAAWWLKWQETPAGKAWTAWNNVYDTNQRLRESSPQFESSVSRDGTFRIDDMPAGDYSLSVRFDQDTPGDLSNYRFSIPPLEDNRSDQELDLGVLTLEKK